jgi:hypothetical protein
MKLNGKIGLGYLKRIIHEAGVVQAKKNNRYFISISNTAKKFNISVQTVKNKIKEGDIIGAYMVGDTWIIPSDWSYKRIKREKQLEVRYNHDPARKSRRINKFHSDRERKDAARADKKRNANISNIN